MWTYLPFSKQYLQIIIKYVSFENNEGVQDAIYLAQYEVSASADNFYRLKLEKTSTKPITRLLLELIEKHSAPEPVDSFDDRFIAELKKYDFINPLRPVNVVEGAQKWISNFFTTGKSFSIALGKLIGHRKTFFKMRICQYFATCILL